MTIEQKVTITKAALILGDASGLTVASCRETIQKDKEKRKLLSDGLRLIAGGVSPLADELDAVFAEELKPESNEKPEA